MNDNVRVQSPNVKSEPREVLNERNSPLAKELKQPHFRIAVRSVNDQVHPGLPLRPDAVVSFKAKLNILCAALLLMHRVGS